MAIQTHIRAPLLLLAAIATAAAKLTPEWRVVSAAKGVTTRALIEATSQLCAVHGEAVVEASVAELMSVFGDTAQFDADDYALDRAASSVARGLAYEGESPAAAAETHAGMANGASGRRQRTGCLSPVPSASQTKPLSLRCNE